MALSGCDHGPGPHPPVSDGGPECALQITATSCPEGEVGQRYSCELTTDSQDPLITWSVMTGELPRGIALDEATGEIAGSPDEEGQWSLVIKAQASCGAWDLQSLELIFRRGPDVPECAELTLGGGVLAEAALGQAYEAALVVSGGESPLTWSLEGELPPGLELAQGVIQGVVGGDLGASYTFSVAVMDSCEPPQERDVTCRIDVAGVPPLPCPELTLSSGDLPLARVGEDYQDWLQAQGGTPPLIWSLLSGVLPPGLSLSAAGALEGLPSLAGTFDFTVVVTDSCETPLVAQGPFTLEVREGLPVDCDPLEISTLWLLGAVVGTDYRGEVRVEGGQAPYLWQVEGGQLPSGLELAPEGDMAVIQGIPDSEGQWAFTLSVQDSCGEPQTISRPFNIIVGPPGCAPLAITTTSLPSAMVGQDYVGHVRLLGGTPPLTWELEGELPGGIEFNGGHLTGTPTQEGSFAFTVRVSDSCPSPWQAQQDLELEVMPPDTVCPPVTIVEQELAEATLREAYHGQLQAQGGVPPLVWSLVGGSLPSGITLDPATGALDGRPLDAGSYDLVVSVTDSCVPAQEVTAQFAMVVAPAHCEGVEIVVEYLPGATLGVAYEALLAARGQQPFTWRVTEGSLPPGLALEASTALIRGVPEDLGTFHFLVEVSDSCATPQVSERWYDINVVAPECPPLHISTTILPVAALSQPYAGLIEATGDDPLTFSLGEGSLPPGLRLLPAGRVAGTPTALGSYSFQASVTDACPATRTSERWVSLDVLDVECPELAIETTEVPNGGLGQAYEAAIQIRGGYGEITFFLAGGDLPPGITLTEEGILQGTPTEMGRYGIQVGVTDTCPYGAQQVAQGVMMGVGCPQVTVLPEELPAARVGEPYEVTLEAQDAISPVTWALGDGVPPRGITLENLPTISGIPLEEGVFRLVIMQMDSCEGREPRGVEVFLNVQSSLCPPLEFITTSLPQADEGVYYDELIAIRGGVPPYEYSLEAGNIHDGLSLDPVTGHISGVPEEGGVAQFAVRVQDSCVPPQRVQAQFELTVIPDCPLVEILTESLPYVDPGEAIFATLLAAGGTPPYTWSISNGSLPPGMSLNPSTGAITGSSREEGNYGLRVQVDDSCALQRSAQRNLLIVVGHWREATTHIIENTTIWVDGRCNELTNPTHYEITMGALETPFGVRRTHVVDRLTGQDHGTQDLPYDASVSFDHGYLILMLEDWAYCEGSGWPGDGARVNVRWFGP